MKTAEYFFENDNIRVGFSLPNRGMIVEACFTLDKNGNRVFETVGAIKPSTGRLGKVFEADGTEEEKWITGDKVLDFSEATNHQELFTRLTKAVQNAICAEMESIDEEMRQNAN